MFGTIEQILMLSRNIKVLQNDQAVLKVRHVGEALACRQLGEASDLQSSGFAESVYNKCGSRFWVGTWKTLWLHINGDVEKVSEFYSDKF